MLYRFSMRILPRSTGVALAALATLLLSGCLPSTPVVTPEPLPSSTPVFASDEMALAAATEAYRAYLAMSDEITADGGANPERISKFVGSEMLDKQIAQYAPFQERDLSTSGASSFDTMSVEQVDDRGDGSVEVTTYVCLDVSRVRILDAVGADVTSGDRVNRLPLEVSFASRDQSGRLLIAQSDSWRGTNFC